MFLYCLLWNITKAAQWSYRTWKYKYYYDYTSCEEKQALKLVISCMLGNIADIVKLCQYLKSSVNKFKGMQILNECSC